MKYSVIIPVYQTERYLKDCVNSLLNQTVDSDHEIILVDDGSKDSSGKIADDLANEYESIKSFIRYRR